MEFNTRLLHGEAVPVNPGREILPPIAQVTAFRYGSMEELEKVIQHKSMGYAYSRIGNPTMTALEQRINELEGGVGAVCCSSGMAAIKTMLIVTHEMAFARAVADRVIFLDGGSVIEDTDPESFFGSPRTDRAKRFLQTFEFESVN